MSQQVEALVERLTEADPDLAPMLSEHRQRFGEQAPQAFLRTAAFVTAAGYQSADPDSAGQFQRLLDFLESEVGSDDEIDALIAASFLANLPLDDDPRGSVGNHLGPKLRGLLGRRPSTTSTHRAVHRLVAAEPALAGELNEHIETYDELLPHVFMGELIDRLTEWSAPARSRTSPGSATSWRRWSVSTTPTTRSTS
ncbi:hypothetical protein [Actinopolymorpha pittospori]|uniref:Uncharacterized protein n=1 Tax=Actinopolymorpha pittospori TaxID=648752 RepID=A0A927N2T1_9ACTN|nr:hypothetical protein [Actinopolymorpha pittospori]MBE1607555.1 hypothetical protein [Actinopolymorpha pittospori]